MKEKYEAFMPNLNSFNKEIWEERYFKKLNYKEKLVWLYLITNTITSGVFFFSDYTAKRKINSSNIEEIAEWDRKNGDIDCLLRSEIKNIINKFISDGKITPLKDSNWIFLSYFTDYDYKSILEFTMDIKKLRLLINDYVNIRETITKHQLFFNNLTEKVLYFLNNRRRLDGPEKRKKQNSRMIKEYLFLYKSLSLSIPDSVKVFTYNNIEGE